MDRLGEEMTVPSCKGMAGGERAGGERAGMDEMVRFGTAGLESFVLSRRDGESYGMGWQDRLVVSGRCMEWQAGAGQEWAGLTWRAVGRSVEAWQVGNRGVWAVMVGHSRQGAASYG